MNYPIAGGEKPSVDLNDLMKDPSLASVFRPTNTTTTANGLTSNGLNSLARPALLDTPKSRPILLSNPPPPASTSNTTNSLSTEANSVTNNLNNLLNAQNLNQLLGSLSNSSASVSTGIPEITSQPPPVVPCSVATQPQQALLGAIPTSLASNGLYHHHAQQQQQQQSQPQQQQQQQQPQLHMSGQSLLGFPAAYNTSANPAATSTNPFYIQQQPQQLYQQPQQPQLFGLQGFTTSMVSNPQQAAAAAAAAAFLNPNAMTFTNPNMTPSTIMNSLQHVPMTSYPNQQAPIGSGVYSTPTQGLKRKFSIPPSPEQSPDGPYIGQHSQGLGGHYASSYLTKKAKY